MTFRAKLTVALLLAGLLPTVALTALEMIRMDDSARHAVQSELRLSDGLKKDMVQNWFGTLIKVAESLSHDPTTLTAMVDLDQASDLLMASPSATVDEQSMAERYSYQVGNTANVSPDALARWTRLDQKARVLQSLYVATNPQPVGQKHRLDDAGDGSPYSDRHKVHHPFFRSYLEEFGFYDIFLIEPKKGSVVYTVFKETDYGTSMFDGPYSQTAFGKAVAEMIRNGGRDPFVLVDFEAYEPSYNLNAAFVLTPLKVDSVLIGILAFQIPIEPINAILQRTMAGFTTADAVLIGPDKRLRSVPLLDSTLQVGSPLSGALVETAVSGAVGSAEQQDYAGTDVLAAYEPVPLPGLNWSILSEVSSDEAFAQERAALKSALLTAAVSGALITLCGYLLGAWLLRPVRKLTSEVEELSAQAIGALEEASSRAKTAADVMVATATQTNRQSSVVKENSARSATNVAAVAAAVEQMSASSQEVVQGVGHASALIENAAGQAESAMATLADLEQVTQRIEGVAADIGGIAARTDLLALNAAVEAARAGDAGRGFGVVADEVRKLAAQTTRCTDEISAQMQSVTSAVDRNVIAIRNISQVMGEVRRHAQSMSAASREQGEVSSSIAARMADTAQRVAMVDLNIADVETSSADAAVRADEMREEMKCVDAATANLHDAMANFVGRVQVL